jgi:hypothetical protein
VCEVAFQLKRCNTGEACGLSHCENLIVYIISNGVNEDIEAKGKSRPFPYICDVMQFDM